MAMSHARGVAALTARRLVEPNSAITAIIKGHRPASALASRRDSIGIGKLDPSPTMIAIANHAAKKPPTRNGSAVLALVDSEVREEAWATMTAWAAIIKIAKAKIINELAR